MRRSLAALVPVIAALMVAAPASADPGGSNIRRAADEVMQMSYGKFASYKRDHHPSPFDWESNGCDNPTPPAWKDLFRRPCDQHDFGYWNYGHSDTKHGLELGVNENTRAWIDHRLLEEMVRLCKGKYSAWWRRPNKVLCIDEAGIIYAAVRNFGRDAYYH